MLMYRMIICVFYMSDKMSESELRSHKRNSAMWNQDGEVVEFHSQDCDVRWGPNPNLDQTPIAF